MVIDVTHLFAHAHVVVIVVVVEKYRCKCTALLCPPRYIHVSPLWFLFVTCVYEQYEYSQVGVQCGGLPPAVVLE